MSDNLYFDEAMMNKAATVSNGDLDLMEELRRMFVRLVPFYGIASDKVRKNALRCAISQSVEILKGMEQRRQEAMKREGAVYEPLDATARRERIFEMTTGSFEEMFELNPAKSAAREAKEELAKRLHDTLLTLEAMGFKEAHDLVARVDGDLGRALDVLMAEEKEKLGARLHNTVLALEAMGFEEVQDLVARVDGDFGRALDVLVSRTRVDGLLQRMFAWLFAMFAWLVHCVPWGAVQRQ